MEFLDQSVKWLSAHPYISHVIFAIFIYVIITSLLALFVYKVKPYTWTLTIQNIFIVSLIVTSIVLYLMSHFDTYSVVSDFVKDKLVQLGYH